MNNRTDLNGVAIFVRIVEAGSLTGAARLLQIPKTTVSKRLADLEASLGVALITRTTRKLTLTDMGKTYFEQARVGLRQLEEARGEISRAREAPAGRLRLTAPVDVSHAFLPALLDAYLKRYPRITVDVLVTNRNMDLLGEGVDLAIRAGKLRDSRLVGRKFVELSSSIYASAEFIRRQKSPLQPQDLPGIDFVGFAGLRRLSLVKGRTTVKIDPKPRMIVDDLETVRELIARGTGVGWLPDFIAQSGSARLVPALPEWRTASAGGLHFLYPNPKHPSVNVKAFIAVALEMLPQVMAGMPFD